MLFVPNIKKLQDFSIGDVGIADTIVAVQIAPIAASILGSDDKATFEKISVPDKSSGLHAAERTIIQTQLETVNAWIELAKIKLELMAQMQYMTAVFNGGPNPENNPTSFLFIYNQLKPELDKYKTGFEPDSQTGSNTTVPVKPKTLYLGTWQSDKGSNWTPTTGSARDGEFSIGQWPQWRDKSAYINQQTDRLNAKISPLPESLKKIVRTARSEDWDQEWNELEEQNQLKRDFSSQIGAEGLYYWFQTVTTNYLGQSIEIDPESDYKYVLDITGSDIKTLRLTATLQNDPSNAVGSQLKFPLVFLGGQKKVPTIIAFINRVLPVIIEKLVPVLDKIKKLFEGPTEFIGNILLTKLSNNFQFLDPSLKDRPRFDNEREKYWSDQQHVLDGTASLSAGLLSITLGLKEGLPFFKVGKEKTTEPPQATFQMIANLAALPLNLLKGVFDFFVSIVEKVLTIFQIPGLVIDLLTFDWLKDLMKPEKFLEYLGAVDGDLTKIPMFNIPSAGNLALVPEVINGFLKMLISFFNALISIVNSIIGDDLIPILPIP